MTDAEGHLLVLLVSPLLCLGDRCAVCLRAIGHTEHARTLERSLEVTFSRLSKNMNPDGLGVVDAFQPHDRLGEQRLRELEIEVHDTHESNAQVYRAEQFACF